MREKEFTCVCVCAGLLHAQGEGARAQARAKELRKMRGLELRATACFFSIYYHVFLLFTPVRVLSLY